MCKLPCKQISCGKSIMVQGNVLPLLAQYAVEWKTMNSDIF